MRQLIAFTKKEFIESMRTGKLFIMTILFVLFGILNPVIAKLTPFMFDMLADQMKEQGITITGVEVTAMTSWEQFYKNLPIGLIVLVIMYSGILVAEYQKGTLINMLTKGLSRHAVLAAKTILTVSIWTLCYWISFGITFGYNAYFWDNSIASHLWLGAVCIYLFGLWLISLIMFASTLSNTTLGVMLITGGAVAISYVIAIVPTISKYLPTQLLSSGSLLKGGLVPKDLTASLIICGVLIVVNYIAANLIFRKKRV